MIFEVPSPPPFEVTNLGKLPLQPHQPPYFLSHCVRKRMNGFPLHRCDVIIEWLKTCTREAHTPSFQKSDLFNFQINFANSKKTIWPNGKMCP